MHVHSQPLLQNLLMDVYELGRDEVLMARTCINPLTPRDFIKNTNMSPYFFKWILTCFRSLLYIPTPISHERSNFQFYKSDKIILISLPWHRKVLKTVIFVFFRYL